MVNHLTPDLYIYLMFQVIKKVKKQVINHLFLDGKFLFSDYFIR